MGRKKDKPIFDRPTLDLQNEWIDELTNLHGGFLKKNSIVKTSPLSQQDPLTEFMDLESHPRVKFCNEAMNDPGLKQ